MHYSRKYHNSPMPWSVFFKGGYAIHGTNAIRRLGRPASHGCIRVHPRNAKKLYQLIKRYGKQNTRIIIRG
jgi:lipoprotein-anchoring transpeptidase ErfK/SrfK